MFLNRILAIALVVPVIGNVVANGDHKTVGSVISNDTRQYITDKPVRFTENKGQLTDMEGKTVPFVLFKVDAPSLEIYITEKGITYMFLKMEEGEDEADEENRKMKWDRIDMTLNGASIKRENIIKEGRSTDFVQYFSGHCPDGITDIHSFEKIIIKEIYPDIDWVLYNSDPKGLKYDFIVHPGADIKKIELIYSSPEPLRLNRNGEVEIKTNTGTLTERSPVSYQQDKEIATHFVKSPDRRNNLDGYETRIHFAIDNYNIGESLIIDPQLVWGTYYGGNSYDGFLSVKTDNAGNVFACGYSKSTNFPVYNPSTGNYYSGANNGDHDIQIVKFDNNGVRLWATYYGGSSYEEANSIAVDVTGNIFVTGYSQSTNFPVLNKAGAYNQAATGGAADAYILKFSNGGTRLWATYYGGSALDDGTGIVFDTAGNLFIAGRTYSANFPTLNFAGAYNQSALNGTIDAFILKFDINGARVWATYYGGSGFDQAHSIACDAFGNVFVGGSGGNPTFPTLNPGGGAYFQTISNSFILKFNSTTCASTWATNFGGPGFSVLHHLAVDAGGNIFVTGKTTDTSFPTLDPGGGAYYDNTYNGGTGFIGDAYIAKFSGTNNALLWSSYYGGSSDDQPFATYNGPAICVDNCGNVYVTGRTKSTDFPTLNPGCGGYLAGYGGGGQDDVFILKFNNNGVRLWATYNGTSGTFGIDFGSSVTTDANNNLFAVGEWQTMTSNGLLNSAGAYYQSGFAGIHDAFIMKFIPITPAYTQSQVNATSCSPCNGTATISLTCGEPDYSYAWSNGSSTLSTIASNTITGLCPGTYTVTTTSNCNQVRTATFVITGTPCGGITVTATGADICPNTCATITAAASNGTGPYTYTWSNNETTQTISPCPVSSTTYTVTITDNTGATASSTTAITINPAVTVTISATNLSCNGSNDGTATAIAGGGSPAFMYNWSGVIQGSGFQVSGLSAGTYTVTVTDNKGCTATSTATFTSPPPLSGQFAKGTANCVACGCKEWLMVTASGGTSPYSYSWPDGYVTRYKNQLCPGNYIVKVTDKNGCSMNINLTAP
ncbi:MAG: SBBP repeat-containing protein [Bacteroidetes bacterium]|nr:SBBP repeat-containing protein [Bacteroidota bacterium]